MRLNRYLNEDICNIFGDLYYIMNENVVTDKINHSLEVVANKFGLRIIKSKSLVSYISDAERGVVELFNLLCLYLIANKEGRSEIKSEIIQKLKSVNKRELTDFLVKMDTMFFGVTSLVRHLLEATFGINITSYEHWTSNVQYIISNLKKVRDVLIKMEANDEEMNAFDNLYDVILKNTGIHEELAGGGVTSSTAANTSSNVLAGGQPVSPGATTSVRVAKYYPKLNMVRRKRKKKGLRELL